jgi:hypothetical protein
MKSSVDWKSDGRVGLQFAIAKGDVLRMLGGVCGVEILWQRVQKEVPSGVWFTPLS